MRVALMVFWMILAGSFAFAKDIAPSGRPVTADLGALVDPTRPAFVPQFAVARALPALQTQRDHALTFASTPIIVFPWGCAPYPMGMLGYRPNHGFFR